MILFLLDLRHLRGGEHRLDFLQCRTVVGPYLVMLLFVAECEWIVSCSIPQQGLA